MKRDEKPLALVLADGVIATVGINMIHTGFFGTIDPDWIRYPIAAVGVVLVMRSLHNT